MDDCSATVAQFEMARNEIGVEVRQEDVAYVQTELFSIVKVLLNIALRIDKNGRCRRLISEEIRRVGETTQIMRV